MTCNDTQDLFLNFRFPALRGLKLRVNLFPCIHDGTALPSIPKIKESCAGFTTVALGCLPQKWDIDKDHTE